LKIQRFKTNDMSVAGVTNTLVVGEWGTGKTTQALNYQNTFGKGLILSGESGLQSLMKSDIDYIPFDGFAKGDSPFREIIKWITGSDEYKKEDYQWIMVDSMTELSQLCIREEQAHFEAESGNPQDMRAWGQYNRKMLAAAKMLRDLPIHTCLTSLQKSDRDDNGVTRYIPLVEGSTIRENLPGLYDNVFFLVRKDVQQGEKTTVKWYTVTGKYGGYSGKSRDAFRRLSPVEEEHDITKILMKLTMSEADYKSKMKKGASQ